MLSSGQVWGDWKRKCRERFFSEVALDVVRELVPDINIHVKEGIEYLKSICYSLGWPVFGPRDVLRVGMYEREFPPGRGDHTCNSGWGPIWLQMNLASLGDKSSAVKWGPCCAL